MRLPARFAGGEGVVVDGGAGKRASDIIAGGSDGVGIVAPAVEDELARATSVPSTLLL